MPNAAIYTRLSLNRDGEKTGTDRQEADCRALCKRQDLKVVRVYTDDDRSAYSGKPRPSFEAMLRELDQYDVLVYWKTDRLVRRTVQFWKVVEACEKAGVRLVSVVDPIDTSSPIGKGVAGMLAAMGEQESHNTSLRVTRKNAEAATLGLPHGHRRAFGYDPTGTFIIEAEADAIREARDRIFKGSSMSSICSDWNKRGVMPVSAPAWRVSTFKRMICGPKIAGLRQYQGEVVAAGTWPEIISSEDRDRILAVLGDPRLTRRGRPASYLLTGLVVCGRCHKTLRSGVRGNGERKWACMNVPGDESHCGRLSARADHVDNLVEDAILYRLDSPALAKALKQKSTPRKPAAVRAVASVTELEARITQLGVDHDEGMITRKEWLDRRALLTSRLDEARLALTPDTSDSEILGQFVGVDVAARWEALTLEQQRAVARALIQEVTVAPAQSVGNTFDDKRVDVIWRA